MATPLQQVAGNDAAPLTQPLGGFATRAMRWVWEHVTIVLMIAVSIALTRFDPAYNHIVGAYGLVSLLGLNLKVWSGKASTFDVRLPLCLLGAGVWMWWRGNADIIPYLGILLFACTAFVCALHLALRRPLAFREDDRVAENYLDTGAQALLAVASVAMSLAWIPEPRYMAVPFTLLLAFRFALPLRRVLYPLILRVVGLQPTSGRAAGTATAARLGFGARLAFAGASALLAVFAASRVVFTQTRYDVSHPKLYSLPTDLLDARRSELERYVAAPPGSLDSAALTELGLVLHDLGLFNRADLARAHVVVERAMFLDPANVRAIAIHGTSLTAESIYDHPALQRMGFISDGLAQLDRAVALAPDDPIVRLSRLNVCLGLPPFAHRTASIREDTARLLALVRARPTEMDFILPFVYQRAGDAYERLGEPRDARRYWREALAELPDGSPIFQEISSLIAALPGETEAMHVDGGHEPASHGAATTSDRAPAAP